MTASLQLRMRPVATGARTELSLEGTLPTSVSAELVRDIICALARWSIAPVAIVMVVDEGTASSWCECWSSNLSAAPSECFEVRFELAGIEVAP